MDNKAKARQLLESAEDLHPLDRKVKGWLDMMLPEDNYHRQVCRALVDILQDDGKISEKAFSKMDELMVKADKAVRTYERTVQEYSAKQSRPELCAEAIFDIMRLGGTHS